MYRMWMNVYKNSKQFYNTLKYPIKNIKICYFGSTHGSTKILIQFSMQEGNSASIHSSCYFNASYMENLHNKCRHCSCAILWIRLASWCTTKKKLVNRLDISFFSVVAIQGQYQYQYQYPTEAHWKLIKLILQHFKDTMLVFWTIENHLKYTAMQTTPMITRRKSTTEMCNAM